MTLPADPAARALAANVSRETFLRLEAFAALLKKWNPVINLVAGSTLRDLWARHMLDSAQVLDLAPESARTWADLGSGGGFPGLVVAILAAERRPDLRVTLVESDQRKATFLRTVARETGISARILSERVEDIPPLNADVVSARALAPLSALLDLSARHLAPGGTVLFPKGASHAGEVTEALERWRFAVQNHPSRTDPQAVILRIGEIARA